MSSIGEIRAGLVTVINGAEGINTTLPYPPNMISVNGTAWLGFFRAAIEMGGSEQRMHVVPLTVIVNRNARLDEGLEVTEPVLDAVLAEIAVHQGLGMPTRIDGVFYTSFEQGIWEIGGAPYVGFQVILEIAERFPVQYDVG